MEVEKITPAGRRLQRVAMKLGIFVALYAALKVNILFEGSGVISLLIIALAFFLAYYFTSRQWLKTVILALAIMFWVPVTFLLVLIPEGTVSGSAISPDGRVVAEVYEVPRHFMRIDYNFVVRLKTKDRQGNSHYKDLFVSPDEGPPEAERLLWSKDGRYLLLLGTRFFGRREEARLASGEYLYLLVDTEQDIVYSNASQLRERRPFSVNDLSGMDFGESFTPLSQ